MCSARGDGESEAARRIKTQLMVEMQGVGSDNNKVLILAATNLPYNLDQVGAVELYKYVRVSECTCSSLQLCLLRMNHAVPGLPVCAQPIVVVSVPQATITQSCFLRRTSAFAAAAVAASCSSGNKCTSLCTHIIQVWIFLPTRQFNANSTCTVEPLSPHNVCTLRCKVSSWNLNWKN